MWDKFHPDILRGGVTLIGVVKQGWWGKTSHVLLLCVSISKTVRYLQSYY